MQLNQAARELIFKVVYYGPGMAGKTSNLTWLKRQAPAGTASELVTVDTHSERTLHFDLLALELGQVQGHHIRAEFHTVPGQSYYAATRKLVLTGADAVVFVADSRREALDENIASMNEMLDNLRQLGMPSQIPVVLQYNKQDLATAVRPEQLDPLMNVRSWPSRGTCAITGQGISECAKDILAMLADAAAEASLPEVPSEISPRTWLISCHRCQAMLEVPDAAIGAIYTCGVCAAPLEVIDPDRGLTRVPQPGATPAPRPQQPQRLGDPSDYAMKTLPTQPQYGSSESALTRAPQGTPRPGPAGNGDFPLAGWEVVAFLDESAQGRRLRVRDTASGRTCRALVMSPSIMSQPGYADAFEAHVRMAGPLKHPHVLPLLEMRPAEGTFVLLSADMPEHEPLNVVLGRRRALAPPHAMGILRQVVLALEDAARAGVVHGWLRPECILVSPDGTVLVDEFAVPKNHRFLVRELAGASAATEYYLAPEHLGDDARSDLRSDMFLCGALLYRMVTGEGLVTGYNAHEALHKLMAGGGKPLRSVGNTVSRDLELFYRQLTALNRGERFDTYRKLVEILDRFGGGAKRQTLRLTQPVGAPPGRGLATPGGGSHRPTTGIHARPPSGTHRQGTASWRAPTGPLPHQQQRRTGTGEFVRPQRRSGGGGMAVIAVVVAVLTMVGAVAYVMLQRQPAVVQTPVPINNPRPISQPEAVRPVAPVTPVTPKAPVKPATAGTIGSVPPDQQPVLPTASPAQAPAKPVAPTVAAPANQAVPPAPPAELTPGERRDLLNRIADLILEERFQQALVESEGLPAAEDRQQQYQQVISRRETRRTDLEARSRVVNDLATIQALLRPALDGTWGIPGDREWARGLLDQAEARLAGAGTPAAGIQGDPAAPAPTPTPDGAHTVPAPTPDAAFAVLSALAKGETGAAKASAENVQADSADGRALRLAVASYGQRPVLLERVAKARSAKLRLTHPTTRESVDVVGAAPSGLDVTAPGGATSALTWSQLGSRDLGRLLGEAAAAPGATPEDNACAVTGLVIGGDAVLATVHLRKVRSTLTPELAGELDTLIAIGRRAESLVLLERANEAQKTGSAKVLADCLAELHKPERAAVAAVAAALPRLDAALKNLQEAKAAGPAKPSDRVTFDALADLNQFETTGTWQVNAGVASNNDPAKLTRKDAGNAKSVQIILTPAAKRGSVTLDFRGLRVVFDLAAGQFATQVADKVAQPKTCNVVERVPNTLYLAYVEDGNRITVELNGQVISESAMGDLGETCVLAVANGAQIQLDEVSFTRLEAASPARAAIRRLGWEPVGSAALDEKAQAITLAGSPNTPAAITSQVPGTTIGYTLEVKGDGPFRIQLDGQGGDQQADLTLVPGESQRLTVRWAAGTFAVLDSNGVPLQSVKLDRAVTGIRFIAYGQATIVLPIRPNRM